MKFTLIFALILCSTLSHGKVFAIRKLKPTQVQFRINPFLRDCRKLLNTAPLTAGQVEIIGAPDANTSDMLSIGLKLKPGFTAFMSGGKVLFQESGKYEATQFSEEDIELKTDEKGIAAITIPYKEDEGGMRVPMAFRLPDGSRFTAYMQIKILGEENIQALLVPIVSLENQKGLCLKSQAWLGIGGSFFSYDQSIPESETNAKFSSLTPLSYSAELKYFHGPSWAFVTSYKSAPGKMKSGAASTSISSQSFKWDILQFETQYRPYDLIFAQRDWTFYPFFKVGIQDHKIPRLAIDDSDNAMMKTISLTNAHLGVGMNVVDKNNYFIETYLNYQMKASSQGYSIQPKLMFDGSFGVGKMLNKKMALGFFWYGQWHQFDYRATSGIDQKPGDIKYLFSNFDVRLGWVF